MRRRREPRIKRPNTVFLSGLFLVIIAIILLPGFSEKEEAKIVEPEIIYSSSPFYMAINESMKQLDIRYGEITELREIGESVDGHSILAISIGDGEDNVLILGGMHGREAITSVLLLDQIEEILIAYTSEDAYSYGGYQTKKILDDVCLWFVPLMNPDGAEISLNKGITLNNQVLLNSINQEEQDLGKWKANLNGVDLNRNFTRDKFGTVEDNGHAYYPGSEPFSEPETRAIVEFTNEMNFVGVLNVHAAGEIIYWDMPYEEIAQRISKLTGYSLVPPSENPPMGTYDTWYLSETGNPVLTIEIGEGFLMGPMEFEKYDGIWEKNWLTPIVFAREMQKVQDVAIFFQGEELQLTIPPIREQSGQVLIPLRETMEKIGAEVQWEKQSKIVRISIGGITKNISQKSPAKIIGGTTYLPMRDLLEAFNYNLDWDNYTKTAFITELEDEVSAI